MSLLGPYSVQDYYQLYQHRNDADQMSSWEHINSILFRKLKLVALLVLFSLGSAYAIHSFTRKTGEIVDTLKARLDDPRGGLSEDDRKALDEFRKRQQQGK